MSDIKKGKKSWTPSNLGDVKNKEAGFRYRWVRKDLDNIEKKKEEGWEFVSSKDASKTQAIHPDSRPDEPNPITSNIERRDGVLMRLDEDTATAREEYHKDRVQRTESRLKAQTEKELGSSVHGEIIKERKGVRTII
jgi:hypothetical protein